MLKKIEDQFIDLLADIDSGNTVSIEDAAARVHDHVVRVNDATASLIGSDIGAKVSVALKVLWDASTDAPLVRRIARDQKAIYPAGMSPPNAFLFSKVTAFESIVRNPKKDYFVEDNLNILEAKGKYKNLAQEWPQYYNSIAVKSVSCPNRSRGGLVGFYCADSEVKGLSGIHVKRTLGMAAAHLYSVLQLVGTLDEWFSTPRSKGESIIDAMKKLEPIGWGLQHGTPALINEAANRRYQSTVDLLAEREELNWAQRNLGYQTANITAGIQENLTKEFSDMLIPDSLLSPEDLEIKRIFEYMDRDELESNLKIVAEYNPYAKSLLDAKARE